MLSALLLAAQLATAQPLPATEWVGDLVWRQDDPATFHVIGEHVLSTHLGAWTLYDLRGNEVATGEVDLSERRMAEGVTGHSYAWLTQDPDGLLTVHSVDGRSGRFLRQQIAAQDLWPEARTMKDFVIAEGAVDGSLVDLLLVGRRKLRGQQLLVRFREGKVVTHRDLPREPAASTAEHGLTLLMQEGDRSYSLLTAEGELGRFETAEAFQAADGPHWLPGPNEGEHSLVVVLTAAERGQAMMHRHVLRDGALLRTEKADTFSLRVPDARRTDFEHWNLIDWDIHDGRVALTFASHYRFSETTTLSSTYAGTSFYEPGYYNAGPFRTLEVQERMDRTRFRRQFAILFDEAFHPTGLIHHDDEWNMETRQATRDTRDRQGQGTRYTAQQGYRLFQDVKVEPVGMSWRIRDSDRHLVHYRLTGNQVERVAYDRDNLEAWAAMRAWPGIFYDVADGRTVLMIPSTLGLQAVRGMTPQQEWTHRDEDLNVWITTTTTSHGLSDNDEGRPEEPPYEETMEP